MIHRLRADINTFQPVEFQSGLNVIVAERTEESTVKDSRNGVGKSTLIEIIHFCLGGGVSSGKAKRIFQGALAEFTFTLELDLRGQPHSVSRKGLTHTQVVVTGDFQDVPVQWQPNIEKTTGELIYTIQEWRIVLGWFLFDLSLPERNGKKIISDIYTPTFRSLISYFVRNGKDAFIRPFEHFRKQFEWDKQVNNAYLLNLSWEYARAFQLNKDQEKDIKQLEKSAKTGVLASLGGDIGSLEATRITLEDKIRTGEKQLSSFKVHPQYKHINEQANKLTRQIHDLTNQNVSDQRMVEYYGTSLNNEFVVSDENIINLYNEAGIFFSDTISKHLNDVREFHQKVINNRREFLQTEIKQIQQKIIDREEQIASFSFQRSEFMNILARHGALEEYTSLQKLHAKDIAELSDVTNKLQQLKRIKEKKGTLRIEKEQLQQRMFLDYDERRESIGKAISLFNLNTEALYEVAGRLIINVKSTGYEFDVDIDRQGSGGVEQMEVFCYDLMLAQLWAAKPFSPGFLIHDSIIFDGVDERQVAHAIELASRKSEEFGFQYVCFLNSDAIPEKDFSTGFDIREYAVRELHDRDDSGTLLGFRFQI